MLKSLHIKLIAFALAVSLFACKAGGDYPGLEYAPNMYHSTPYEPLSQITDIDAGKWVSSIDNGEGEYYNSNPYNPHKMTMRVPAANTVRRTESGLLPYRVPKDSLDFASKYVKNPLDSTEAILAEGHDLFNTFCSACHGENGDGQGLVGQRIKGVPSYKVGRVSEVSEGHIFHVITYGKGRMGAHGSQISQEDRWKIVRYVQKLQSQK